MEGGAIHWREEPYIGGRGHTLEGGAIHWREGPYIGGRGHTLEGGAIHAHMCSISSRPNDGYLNLISLLRTKRLTI